MDRIEFIEELQAKIVSQTKVRDELLSSKTKAYNNSIYYLKDELDSLDVDDTNTLYIGNTHGNGLLYCAPTREPEPSSTRTIIELGHKLVELEKECDGLEDDIAKYNNKSIIDNIPALRGLLDGQK